MEIRRTSGPKTTDGRCWIVQISEAPPAAWTQLFMYGPGEFSSVAMPQLVDVRYDGLALVCDEDQIEHWVQYIDKWITRANRSYAEYLAEQTRRAEATERARAAEEQRILTLNERFKNL